MKTVLLTGATDGIGRQTALDLARAGARVIVHGRSAAKVDEVAHAVEATRGGALAGTLVADLGSFAQIRRMAEQALERFDALDVLLNNAGIFAQERRLTEDGLESTFAVNHLAVVLLTHALLPRLRASADGRVVNVSSVAHNRGQIDWDNLQGEREFGGYDAYARSKLANVLFTVELARRLGPSPVVHALHPGVVSTKLLREGFGMGGPDSLAQGAKTSVHCALSEEAGRSTGGYWSDAKPAAIGARARDRELAARFYEASCRMVGVAPLPAP